MPSTEIVFLAAVLTGLSAGILIGAIGVGGIIVVPILIEVGIDVKQAIACAMTSYVAAGLVGATIYFRKGHLDREAALPLLLPAAPAAFVASFSLEHIDDTVLKAGLYALMTTSSVFALIKTLRERGYCGVVDVDTRKQGTVEQKVDSPPKGDDEKMTIDAVVVVDEESQPPVVAGEERLSFSVAATVGVFTGICSALTGTSGPVVGLPILMLVKCPIHSALGFVQAIQVPIAVASAVTYLVLRPDRIDWTIVTALALGISPAVVLGAYVADKIPAAGLKLCVATVLVICSAILVAKLVVNVL